MEYTPTHALPERQCSWTLLCNRTAMVLVVFTICFLVMAPMIWMLIWMKNENPHYTRHRAEHWYGLPTTEVRPAQNAPRKLLLAGKARLGAPSLRRRATNAAPVGQFIASRPRRAYFKFQDGLARLSPVSLRRRTVTTEAAYDLPVMRKPAWQKLAESHRDYGASSPESLGKEETRVEEVARAEGGAHVDIQKPQTALAVGLAV
ncbi:hypothetical protein VP1G_02044 [Cytospora mali]|uniref:Uncharacterized protein n=1 Tax=Cytospora mali TaxID=578113 RepID=A0A194USL3_CYTMA|nr:hypothetical protein VP1G_02044 [Valsa mali var. pyri (nom. inval.)]